MSIEDLTDERKSALAAELQAYIERYLDKQWTVSDAIDMVAEDDDEKRFLQSAAYEFRVYW
jgi:hypothetical protein